MSVILLFAALVHAAGSSCPLPAATTAGPAPARHTTADTAAMHRELPSLLTWRPSQHALPPPLDRRPSGHLKVATFALG